MDAAGFGWSAGDIATAVKVIVEVGEAFISTGGAATKYADALTFLESLRMTLELLESHAIAAVVVALTHAKWVSN